MEHKIHKVTKPIAILIFGIIVPVFVLFQAYLGINSLPNNVTYEKSFDDIVSSFERISNNAKNGNDYSLASLIYTEHANQKTMINKQVMKVSIIQIGFAVISIGMMLIILGINDGGAKGSADFGGISFDIKTGSSGVVVFVVGAVMATAGGVLKNEYKTVPIPDYVYSATIPEYEKSITAYKKCKQLNSNALSGCFTAAFEKINGGKLK